ncbi:MFS transporter [Pseudonocardia parietis]|uniref:EmrB/QacA subfamily drug resistance transporter n=1 Tax=Pseudonocardia parietis TaxID=570936 RepID=A0ABS4VWZ6_9PSEU|nr:MFS transporter [Pseudonocardia parietis]MBP2368321.1 EmrB/QacA subfamily drug resistance transporter [Pseudonocardia parietis]
MNTTSPMSTIWVVALTSVASMMVALDLLVVSTALSTIRRDLDTSVELLQWTVTAYGLAFACLLMTGAALGDRFGRRRMFTCGLALFAVASAACALAPGIGWLIAARAVQGAGAALVLPLAVSLLVTAVPPERRGRALGVFEGVTGLATIAGPPVGGILAHTVGWEWIFWINVPIAAVMIPLVRRRIPESHGPDTAIDTRGLLLITGAGFGLVWALVRGNEAGWTSPGVLAALVIGTALAVAFICWERHHRHPMLPLGLFRSRAFSAGTAAGFLGFAALYGSVFFLAQFMQIGLGYTPLEAGVRLIPWTATLLVIAPLAGMLADRLGDRLVLTVGLALQAAGLAWLGLIASPDLGYATLVVPLIVGGVGASMAIPVVQNTVLGGVAPDALGKASGVNNTTQELGGAFGVAILVAAFTAVGSYASSTTFTTGFAAAIGTCAGLAVAAVIAAWFVPGPGHTGDPHAAGSGAPTADAAR